MRESVKLHRHNQSEARERGSGGRCRRHVLRRPPLVSDDWMHFTMDRSRSCRHDGSQTKLPRWLRGLGSMRGSFRPARSSRHRHALNCASVLHERHLRHARRIVARLMEPDITVISSPSDGLLVWMRPRIPIQLTHRATRHRSPCRTACTRRIGARGWIGKNTRACSIPS